MRYSGGLLGGSWLTALTSDLGAGKFDGAWLVQNFENQNPSNTLWTKQYNVYSNVDTEADRYLEFERWWRVHVNLNAEEIQFIVDELFIGNNLPTVRIKRPEGQIVDLREISSPIVDVYTITISLLPPQQTSLRSTWRIIASLCSHGSGPLLLRTSPSGCTNCIRFACRTKSSAGIVRQWRQLPKRRTKFKRPVSQRGRTIHSLRSRRSS